MTNNKKSRSKATKKEKFISEKIIEWCAGREDIINMPVRALFEEPCDPNDYKVKDAWAYNGILIVGQMIINEDYMSLVSKSVRTGRFVSEDEQQDYDYSPAYLIDKLTKKIKNLSTKNDQKPITVFMRSEAEKLYQQKLDAIQGEKDYQADLVKARSSVAKIAGYNS
ncbi:MAG TPA: hypothetical protein VGF14_02145 [Alphaproteobacteria bacterium]